MVTDHASLTWLRNFKEPEGVVARWITRLQPFDFKIVHRPGKHHSHADGLSRRASRPCKRDTCPECAPLLHQVTPEEDRVRMVTPSDPYFKHFDGYLELVEDDTSLFRDMSTREPTPEQEPVSPELLWYWVITPNGRMIPDWQLWKRQIRPENLVLVVVLWKQNDCWTPIVVTPQLRRSLSTPQVLSLARVSFSLKIRDGVLLRRRRNQGSLNEWQVVAPQTIRSRIFQACHHHKLAAHQGVVRTQALIKRRFYWPSMQKDIESWCQR